MSWLMLLTSWAVEPMTEAQLQSWGRPFEFMVNKMILRQVLFRVLQFFPAIHHSTSAPYSYVKPSLRADKIHSVISESQ